MKFLKCLGKKLLPGIAIFLTAKASWKQTLLRDFFCQLKTNVLASRKLFRKYLFEKAQDICSKVLSKYFWSFFGSTYLFEQAYDILWKVFQKFFSKYVRKYYLNMFESFIKNMFESFIKNMLESFIKNVFESFFELYSTCFSLFARKRFLCKYF
jgi:hypothetical protein